MALLLEDQAVAANSEVESMTTPCTVYAYGVFDGASVYIEICPVDGTPHPVDGARFSGPGSLVISPVGPYDIRAKLANPGPATSVTVEAIAES